MTRIAQMIVAMFFAVLVSAPVLNAQGMPPANVVVENLRSGVISPQTDFVGTVFYQEMADKLDLT